MQRLCNWEMLSFLPFCQSKKPPAYKKMVELLNIVTRVALGILAAIASPLLFTPCFILGSSWGLYHNLGYDKKTHAHHQAIHPSGCGQGFMENIAGMHFPMELTLMANLGITICHLDHHPSVFVPYCAVAVGMWTGQLFARPVARSLEWLQLRVV